MNTISVIDDLTDQVALVSGASRGIGAEIARQLTDLGATVYAGARDVNDIMPALGTPVTLDVSDVTEMKAAIAQITESAGRLDILVNNAGVGGPREPLEEVSVIDLDATLAVNLRGPIVLTSLALPMLLSRPGGRIVNVSSGMGALGEGMQGSYPPYRISKAGLNALTVYLDGEYGDRGLIANAACPGWVRTDLGSPDAPKSAEEGADTPVWLARFSSDGPGGTFWRDRQQIAW